MRVRDNDIQSSSNSNSKNRKSCTDTDKLTKDENARAVAIMDEYAANYNKGLPEWMWI